MPTRVRVVLVAVWSTAAVLLLAACSAATDRDAAADASGPAPRVGGPAWTPRASPTGTMSSMERQVAERLSRRMAAQGLTLTHLDCPAWDRVLPGSMRCRGYLAGLPVAVRVHLQAGQAGEAGEAGERGEAGVGFDARVTTGMVATRRLEETLAAQHWRDPDCGDRPVYPARIGLAVVCRALRSGEPHYLVATVSDLRGRVTIAAYRDGVPSRG